MLTVPQPHVIDPDPCILLFRFQAFQVSIDLTFNVVNVLMSRRGGTGNRNKVFKKEE